MMDMDKYSTQQNTKGHMQQEGSKEYQYNTVKNITVNTYNIRLFVNGVNKQATV